MLCSQLLLITWAKLNPGVYSYLQTWMIIASVLTLMEGKKVGTLEVVLVSSRFRCLATAV